jgi:hypothetical protein
VNTTERTRIPKPKGGIQTDEQEAKWLADLIDLRTREALEASADVKVAPRSNDSLDRLILLCIQRSVARNIKVLKAEVADMRATFDLRYNAHMKAIKRWQEDAPGRELAWPDHVDLVVWLLGENDRLRSEITELKSGATS